jgi:hypothetical protein
MGRAAREDARPNIEDEDEDDLGPKAAELPLAKLSHDLV